MSYMSYKPDDVDAESLGEEYPLALARQRGRDANEEYFPSALASALCDIYIPEYFKPHISNTYGLIAFYQTPEKLIHDVSTPMKLGRFLNKVSEENKMNGLPHITSTEIRDASELFINSLDGDFELTITQDQDEIVAIYRDGIRSCMSNEADYYQAYEDKVVGVYATPDIGVAALRIKGRLIGRAVLNMNGKNFPSYYALSGYYGILTDELNKAGYEEGGNLEGCRILKEYSSEEGYKLPYIDGDAFYIYEGSDPNYLMIGDDGGSPDSDYPDLIWDDQTTQGYTGEMENHTCPYCGERCYEEDLQWIDNGSFTGEVCDSCIDRDFTRVRMSGGYYEYILDEDVETDTANTNIFEPSSETHEYSHLYEAYVPNDASVWSTYHDDYLYINYKSVVQVHNEETDEQDYVDINYLDSSDEVYINADGDLVLNPEDESLLTYEEHEGVIEETVALSVLSRLVVNRGMSETESLIFFQSSLAIQYSVGEALRINGYLGIINEATIIKVRSKMRKVFKGSYLSQRSHVEQILNGVFDEPNSYKEVSTKYFTQPPLRALKNERSRWVNSLEELFI